METNKYIGHTLLKADTVYDKIEALCAEAKGYDPASICVNSYWVSICAELLRGTDVKVCIMAGFPLGVTSTKAKASKAAATIAGGTKGVNMVLNIGETKAGHYDVVRTDVKAAMEAAGGNRVRVVLENCLLTEGETVKAYELCAEAGAVFAKTSTGFPTNGAIPGDVKLMKDTMKGCCLAKAVGRVCCYEDMEKMAGAGANCIDTSVGVKLMQKETSDGGY